jgi:putative endonuclease
MLRSRMSERNSNKERRKSVTKHKTMKDQAMAIAHFVYIAECADGSLYTGYTNDVAKRIETHNAGKGAKYTKQRCPVKPVYTEGYATKEEALRREAQIKRLRRDKKLRLIAEFRYRSQSAPFL